MASLNELSNNLIEHINTTCPDQILNLHNEINEIILDDYNYNNMANPNDPYTSFNNQNMSLETMLINCSTRNLYHTIINYFKNNTYFHKDFCPYPEDAMIEDLILKTKSTLDDYNYLEELYFHHIYPTHIDEVSHLRYMRYYELSYKLPKYYCDLIIHKQYLKIISLLNEATYHEYIGGLNISKILGPSSRNCETLEDCAICVCPLINNDIIQLGCKHEYHTHCITRWVRISTTCPTCRWCLT